MKSIYAACAAFLVVSGGIASAATSCNVHENAKKKTLTLMSDCVMDDPGDRILMPGSGYTLNGNHLITVTGAFKGAAITNASPGGDFTVKDISITAYNLPCVSHSGDDRVVAIYFNNAGGAVSNVTITDFRMNGACGAQEGNGILVRDAAVPDCSGESPNMVTIKDNTVIGYQKNGITCNVNANCMVMNNYVEGLGNTSGIAQNGIQIGYMASGKVIGNTVIGNWYDGVNWSSTGVLPFETANVQILGNTLIRNQGGVDAEAWHWQCPDAYNNQISDNTIHESQYGVIVAAYAFCPYSTGDPHADYNHITDNEIVNTEMAGDIGIYLGAVKVPATCMYTPVAYGNLVDNNMISGFVDPVVHDGDSGGKGGQIRVAFAATNPGAPQPYEP